MVKIEDGIIVGGDKIVAGDIALATEPAKVREEIVAFGAKIGCPVGTFYRLRWELQNLAQGIEVDEPDFVDTATEQENEDILKRKKVLLTSDNDYAIVDFE